MSYELVNTKKVKKAIQFHLLLIHQKTPWNLGKKRRKLSQLSLTQQNSHNCPWAKLLRSSSIAAMPIKCLVQGR